MATSIEVNKQSVKVLLETGKNRKFVIPEYQRPYAWTDEEVETLFDDLVEFTLSEKESGVEDESSYFLGSIVSYENDDGEQEIIDGQQRITTLMLILRALYTKLDKGESTEESKHFKREISPAIWKKHRLTGKIDYTQILIESRVMNSSGNKIFAKILETGTADKKSDDNYSKNYIKLQELINDYAMNNPLLFYDFMYNILNKSILLPIKADSQDTALTIFSTLNDRGLPLSDSDIFKAKIYNRLNDNEKDEFISTWQELDERSKNADETIQRLFYYYMFYLRALENDRKTTTPGLRKYYSKNNFQKLYTPNLIEDLDKLLNLWVVVNSHQPIENESWSENNKIRSVLDCLSSYPNEFWKYPVSIYYLTHSENNNFEEAFLNFLRKLFVTLCARYVLTPTINAVKTAILNLNAEITETMIPRFTFSAVDEDNLRRELKNPHRNTVRMLLKLTAYQHQDEILPRKWEIEHILPKKWEDSYFPNASDDEVIEMVEHIGNKVPFEKKLNIRASNNYLSKKKKEYEESAISVTQNLSKLKTNNWKLDNIRERDIRVIDEIMNVFNQWGLNKADPDDIEEKPSKEEIDLINKIKEKYGAEFIKESF